MVLHTTAESDATNNDEEVFSRDETSPVGGVGEIEHSFVTSSVSSCHRLTRFWRQRSECLWKLPILNSEMSEYILVSKSKDIPWFKFTCTAIITAIKSMSSTVVIATNQRTRAMVVVVAITVPFRARILFRATRIVFAVASLSPPPICKKRSAQLQLVWHPSHWNEITCWQHNSSLPCIFAISTHYQYLVLGGETDSTLPWWAASESESKVPLGGYTEEVGTNFIWRQWVVKETSAMQRIPKHCLANPYSTRCKCQWWTFPHRQPMSSCSSLTLCAPIYLQIEPKDKLETSNQINKGPAIWVKFNFLAVQNSSIGNLVPSLLGTLVMMSFMNRPLPEGTSGMEQLGLPLSANISTLERPSDPLRTYPWGVPCQPPLMIRPESADM